jgi:hypothetical protein
LFSTLFELILNDEIVYHQEILKEAIRFCFTCTNQLCEECLDTVETEHNGHVIYNIENAAKEIRKQTETKIASLKEQIDKARKQPHI